MAHIVIIEDEPQLAQGLRDNLEFENHTVSHSLTGGEGITLVKEKSADLVLLDIMLPDMSGFDVCKKLREDGYIKPIIILSARSQELDKVRGLELGADDYVTKPFGLRELLARISAALRRVEQTNATPGRTSQFNVGERTVDLARQRVTGGTEEHALGYYESEILRILHEHLGDAVSRAELLERIWGVGMNSADRTVDNHIVSLRRKLEPDPKHPEHLLTAHAVGYKLVLK